RPDGDLYVLPDHRDSDIRHRCAPDDHRHRVQPMLGTTLIRFTGDYTANIDPGFLPWLTDQISHMLLPTLALVLMGAATYSRYQRSVMLDVLASDFIRTARSKGRTRKTALVKHGVRVALIPMST